MKHSYMEKYSEKLSAASYVDFQSAFSMDNFLMPNIFLDTRKPARNLRALFNSRKYSYCKSWIRFVVIKEKAFFFFLNFDIYFSFCVFRFFFAPPLNDESRYNNFNWIPDFIPYGWERKRRMQTPIPDT